jgi:hypothetical protein
MIVVVLFLYAVPASAEDNSFVDLISPQIGEPITDQFVFTGMPVGKVFYTFQNSSNIVLAQGFIQNEDPNQLTLKIENGGCYPDDEYLFTFTVNTIEEDESIIYTEPVLFNGCKRGLSSPG